jgi:hypothetical protein
METKFGTVTFSVRYPGFVIPYRILALGAFLTAVGLVPHRMRQAAEQAIVRYYLNERRWEELTAKRCGEGSAWAMQERKYIRCRNAS